MSQALVHAIKNESAAIAKVLIDLDANSKVWDPETNDPIIDYHWKKHSIIHRVFHKREKTKIEQFLINHGAVENVTYRWDDQQIIEAAKNGDTALVKESIRKGANINVKLEGGTIGFASYHNYGYSALTKASQNGHSEIVKELIKSGADISIKGIHDWTALFIAIQNGNLKIVKILAKSGIDVNAKDNKGKTTLDIATQYRQVNVVSYLECIKINGI